MTKCEDEMQIRQIDMTWGQSSLTKVGRVSGSIISYALDFMKKGNIMFLAD